MELENLCEALKKHENETALDDEQNNCSFPTLTSFPSLPKGNITTYNKIYIVWYVVQSELFAIKLLK